MASSSPETSGIGTAKSVLTTAASIAATVVLARSVINDLLPHEIQDMLSFGIGNLLSRYSSQRTIVIEPYNGLEANQVHEAVEIYVGHKVSPATRRMRVSKVETEESISVAVERDETVADNFSGVDLKWTLICRQIKPRRREGSTSEVRSFELVFHKKHLKLVLSSYLPHVIAQSKILKQEKKTLKIFTCDPEQIMYNISEAWISTNLDHPATFETLAMDAEIRTFVLEDLDRFVRRRDYYRKVGKAWKRGYLLYGPPGTGKSSLIAAMANHLRFDIYDLELTALRSNSDLKKLLIAMSNRSILVIEDIDCSVNFDDRNKAPDPESPGYNQPQLTLSGLLNFIDGLWSSCGDERIIIFTTNHREKLDPALLRPGRMDVHIHMSYCTPCGFRTLASNYLDLKDHPLFPEIDHRLRSSEASPAEVAEELIKSNDPDLALKGLIEFLDAKKKEKDAQEAEKEKAGQEEKAQETTLVADEQVDQTVSQSGVEVN